MADFPVNTNLESPLNGLAVAAAAPATAQDRGGGRPHRGRRARRIRAWRRPGRNTEHETDIPVPYL